MPQYSLKFNKPQEFLRFLVKFFIKSQKMDNQEVVSGSFLDFATMRNTIPIATKKKE